MSSRLEGTGVTAAVLHPGVVRAAFAAEDPSAFWKVLLPLIRPLLKSYRWRAGRHWRVG
jgi:hypothetical protein